MAQWCSGGFDLDSQPVEFFFLISDFSIYYQLNQEQDRVTAKQ